MSEIPRCQFDDFLGCLRKENLNYLLHQSSAKYLLTIFYDILIFTFSKQFTRRIKI